MIDITGLNKADVLAGLYNASRAQGMGFLHYQATEMTRGEAEELLAQTNRFDYLKGRVMKIDLKSDTEFFEGGYDRDNGQGSAQRVINSLRNNDTESIKKQHKENIEQSAALTMNRVNEETRRTSTGINLGLADVKDKLVPKIKEAKESVR